MVTHLTRPGRRRFVAMAIALLALATGCPSDQVSMIPPPPPTQPRPATTAVPDFSGAELAAVAGRSTTTSVVLTGGTSTLKGVVRGPDGLIPGATVSIERIVAESSVAGSVPSNADGSYLAPGVRGGRYRLRAFRAPDMAMVEPVITFLAAGEQKVVDLVVARYSGLDVVPAVAPDPPPLDDRTTLVLQVTSRSVDARGFVTATPIVGADTELFGAGSWRVESANPTTTDVNGRGRWILRCTQVGKQPLSVVVGTSDALALDLPPCTVPPDPNAPPPSSSSTTTQR